MRPGDVDFANKLDAALAGFHREQRAMQGIQNPVMRQVFLEQLVESVRRIKYTATLLQSKLSSRRADPNGVLFHPVKAAILHKRQGNIEEAFWLVFLSVHFGRNAHGSWRYAREIYGRLGDGDRWDWKTTSSDPAGFRAWLDAHQGNLRRPGVPGGFGNHRKYESLDALSSRGTGAAVETYVRWVNPPRSHRDMVQEACDQAAGDGKIAFDRLYRSMTSVASFGRLARFDYLSMIGKLELAAITPGSTYLGSSSGPLMGARLLFGEAQSAAVLDGWLLELDGVLHVGMQVLEDALCNWQKSPEQFVRFRG